VHRGDFDCAMLSPINPSLTDVMAGSVMKMPLQIAAIR